MSALMNDVQILKRGGKPAFVVIPYEEFQLIKKRLEKDMTKGEGFEHLIPHDVVKMNVIDGLPMVKAWRLHLNLTQAEVAKKAGITQAALSQIERPGAKPRKDTLQKLAKAMNLVLEQME